MNSANYHTITTTTVPIFVVYIIEIHVLLFDVIQLINQINQSINQSIIHSINIGTA